METIAEEPSADVAKEEAPPSEPAEAKPEVKPVKKRVKKEKIDTSVKTSSDGAPPSRKRAAKPREEAPLDLAGLLTARAQERQASRQRLVESWFR